ncbi:uncharacterized protein LOC124834592 [Vigna umbellata]|uniref:uncharacterized protein LOC124834592 n=1 Tax=Vigna umbellata TaxID=87088 RepID=UPI001F5F1023|nr:uncharacterized protein LOC124834592 [Vigna umbellata]
MAHFPNHHGWMYDRCYSGGRGLKETFVIEVEEFVETARRYHYYAVDGGIRCPCIKCECTRILKDEVVKLHLYQKGFMPNYTVWTFHGEEIPSTSTAAEKRLASGSNTIVHTSEIDQFVDMQEIVDNALRRLLNKKETIVIMKSLQMKPLKGSTESKLSVCIRLMAGKSNWNVPIQVVDFYTKLMLDLTPPNNFMPKNYYQAKKCVSKLGLEVKKIDCYVNGCMLFYDNDNGKHDALLVECKFFGSPRYHTMHAGQRQKKPIPLKSMFYLPIIPRLKRMFTSMQTSEHMTWHDGNKTEGFLCHPSDGEASKHFNRKHSSFASEPRNVRLGLCSDRFTSYIQAFASPYSCWPMIVTPYNLPPEMYDKALHVFIVYNTRKQNFLMRAASIWTINDFPAYDMLSGWSTHGQLACPHCMEHTNSFQLSYGRKSSWFDCHRRFLPIDHPFRRNKKAFRKGQVETDLPLPKLIGSHIWRRVKDYPKVTESGQNKIKGFEE